MRSSAQVPVAVMWLLVAGSASAWAQNAPSSPSLQAPSHATRDAPAKPPQPARRPLHKPDTTSRTVKTPVVPPRGPTHPHKPLTTASPGKPGSVPLPVPAPLPEPALPPEPAQPATGSDITQPDKSPDLAKPDTTAAKLPRFASLRSDDVNMRVGPGTRYRIEWVYKRRDLPVEIEREFDIWRWVRDADGIQGWVHQATLMGRRSFIVEKQDATLRADASDLSTPVAILKPGVIGRIRSCEGASEWCNVQTGSYRGYLRREQFWGVFPGEAVNP